MLVPIEFALSGIYEEHEQLCTYISTSGHSVQRTSLKNSRSQKGAQFIHAQSELKHTGQGRGGVTTKDSCSHPYLLDREVGSCLRVTWPHPPVFIGASRNERPGIWQAVKSYITYR